MARLLGGDAAVVPPRDLDRQRAGVPAQRRRVPGAQGAGRRQVADVGRADPPDLRDAGELTAGRCPHHRADGRVAVLQPTGQPALQPARCRDGAMSARLSDRLIDLLLYGSVAAVLVFFYIPIFTLIGFSFQEGRYLTLPF